MESQRLLGPPTAALVSCGIALVAATAGVMSAPGLASLVLAAVAAWLVWRLVSLSVHLQAGELVVRNTLKTYRFPIGAIDVRPRVVDPRTEFYGSGSTVGYLDALPTAADDNTVRAAKWYRLTYGDEEYFIDALMGRSPSNHERLAWELRHQILAARGELPGGAA